MLTNVSGAELAVVDINRQPIIREGGAGRAFADITHGIDCERACGYCTRLQSDVDRFHSCVDVSTFDLPPDDETKISKASMD